MDLFRVLGRLLEGFGRSGGAGRYSTMITLDSEAALAQCLEDSAQRPVFIFKHSTRCPISSGAHREVAAYAGQTGESVLPVYINLVVESRAVSNQIAAQLGVRHESPQILLVSGGQAVWHTSHGGIRTDALQREAARNCG
jgi:bacillithiol system protein YtxJ